MKRGKGNFSKKSKKETSGSKEDWETVSTGGFAPMWKPEDEGEDVIFVPLSARVVPPRGKVKESAMVVCKLSGGSSENFYSKDVLKGVAVGEEFSIPLSFNLNGDDKLGVHEAGKGKKRGTAILSSLSKHLLASGTPMRIVFDGKIKGGQGSVKLFTIQLPKGTREAMAGKTKK